MKTCKPDNASPHALKPGGDTLESHIVLPPFLRAVFIVIVTVVTGHTIAKWLAHHYQLTAWEAAIEVLCMMVTFVPVSYFCFFRPLIASTNRRLAAEDQLREQARMLDLAHDGIIVRDLNGRVQFWNRGAERLYGWTKDEAIGRNVQEFVYACPQEFDTVNREVIRHGQWKDELAVKTKDGAELTVISHLTLVRDDTGKPKSVLAVIYDITEQKKLEAQFLRAQRLESIGVLAGGIAHDLNNILAPILMSAQILRLKPLEAEDDQMLKTIESSAQRGADIVKQVLTFTRGLDSNRSLLQPRHLIKEVSKIIKETFPKNISLHIDIPGDLWPIDGDGTQIYQTLMNLCVNARDAMPTGGLLTLSAKNVELDALRAKKTAHAAGPYVKLEVSDTGTGIPGNILDKIFDPFFTTKEPGRGTGLGLSTVQKIVKTHGGWVDVWTEQGKGSRFEVYLAASPGCKVRTTTPVDSDKLNGDGELILIIDDEVALCEMMQCMLNIKGYRTVIVSDAPTALARFTQKRGEIALVITDLMMPVMDGRTLIREMKAVEPKARFVISTGSDHRPETHELDRLGIRQVLRKPFTSDRLLTVVKEALNGS